MLLQKHKKRMKRVGLVATLALVYAGVACTSTKSASHQDELENLGDNNLYGSLDDDVDTSLWVEDSYDSSNAIDRGLSESPYRDYDPIATPGEKKSGRKLKKASQKKKSGSDWWSQ